MHDVAFAIHFSRGGLCFVCLRRQLLCITMDISMVHKPSVQPISLPTPLLEHRSRVLFARFPAAIT